MAVKAPVQTVAALTALKALQEDAKRKGLDKMTMDEINAEVAAYRCERRAMASRAITTGGNDSSGCAFRP